ncbi:MAG: thiolase family protein, partial [Deltaproteobacteria bacterium]|nr:thiolase family protein [Deltaproteobacteria bacterium]
MGEVVIVSGVRTPVGRYMGGLKDVEAYDLASMVLSEALARAGVEPQMVDEVIMGQSYQNGEYVNIARMALLKAGWPDYIPGVTVDRRCCTGLEVVRLACGLIKGGEADVVVAGGVESMSNAEFYLPGSIGDLSIWGIPFYDRIQRARVMSQPIERYGVLPSMMSWAETAAKEMNITREECDQWAYESHQKACKAEQEGKFGQERIPVKVLRAKGETAVVDRDEGPRPDTSPEKLARLRPVLGGVCTAGNSSSENDGAAAVVVMSASRAEKMGLEPLAVVNGFSVVGDDPTRTYKTVPKAAGQLLSRLKMGTEQMDLIEIQEAFA